MAFKIPENSFPEQIFLQKYAYPGETTWKETAKRVARAAARGESDDKIESTEKKFYDAINSGDFCPGGRILVEFFLVPEERSRTYLTVMFSTLKIL